MFEQKLTRKEFLKTCLKCTAAWSISPLHLNCLSQLPNLVNPAKAEVLNKGFIQSIEAKYYKKVGKLVQCQLCPRECIVSNGKRGFCEVRENRKGEYYTLVYGNPCAVHIDPIEKKPLFHVLPGSISFSIATAGCNLDCKFCQNWQISQARPEETYNHQFPPERVARLAKENDCRTIAYTYTEPTIFYEYMLETAKKAKKKGILNVCHSNGFINPEPLKELCQFLAAANIDLKGFTEDYYRDITDGELKPVLNSLKIIKQEGVHLELTNLVVTGKNDDLKTVKKMCQWIKDELGKDTPIHFSRFFPMYRLKNLPPTPVETLERIGEIAQEVGLEYIYIGNVPGHKGNNTYCPGCKELLIKRRGYFVVENNLEKGICKFCKHKVPGIWE